MHQLLTDGFQRQTKYVNMNVKIHQQSTTNNKIKENATVVAGYLDIDLASRICQPAVLCRKDDARNRTRDSETRAPDVEHEFGFLFVRLFRARRIHRRLKHVQLLGQLPGRIHLRPRG